MRNTAILLIISMLFTSLPAPLTPFVSQAVAGPMVCVSDLNNNGYAGEEGEAGLCNPNAQNDAFYCPIESAQCTKEEEILTKPSVQTCPDTYELNASKTLCTREGLETTEASDSCPADYVYNSATRLCTKEQTVTRPVVNECPGGYNLNDKETLCTKTGYELTNPSYNCPSGYNYNSSNGHCEKRTTNKRDPSYSCPAGQSMSNGKCYSEISGDQCGSDPDIPKECMLNHNHGIFDYGYGTRDWRWPPSLSHNGDPSLREHTHGGYIYIRGRNSQDDWNVTVLEICRCPASEKILEGNATRSCPSGYGYKSGSKKCEKESVVRTDPSVSCPSSYSYNTSRKKCEKTVVETISVAKECPSGYSYNAHTDLCEDSETITTNPERVCPSGFNYKPSKNICEKETVESIAVSQECEQAGYAYNTSTKRCEKSRLYDACPLSGGGSCVKDATNGKAYCSPNPCFDRDEETSIDNIDGTMLVDNGEVDETGACMDEVLIFNGRASECLESGVSTGFKNCCNSDEVQKDSMGSMSEMRYATQTIKGIYQVTVAAGSAYTTALGAGASQASAAQAASSAATAEIGALMNPATIVWAIAIYVIMDFLLAACPTMSIETSMAAASGLCHQVGNYCKKRWLGECVQKARSFCCYNSKMGRIVNEGGRSQLKSFNGFGEAPAPDCRGFSPEEFASLDFSRIDMTEYYDELRYKVQGEVQSTIMDKTEEYFESIK